MGSAARAGLLAVPLILPAPGLLACASRPRGPAPACVTLARTFYVIAEHRRRGMTRADQVALAHEAVGSRSPRSFRRWVHMIELVYRFSDASPREVSFTVLDHCRVDARGRAAVETLWPTR